MKKIAATSQFVPTNPSHSAILCLLKLHEVIIQGEINRKAKENPEFMEKFLYRYQNEEQ